MNTNINHLNLAVANTASLMLFFERVFGFRIVERRGSGLAILTSADGFVLTLMSDKSLSAVGYPKTFHLGFIQPDRESVVSLYERIVDLGFPASKPQLMRGAAFGFYVTPSDGVMVEISSYDDCRFPKPGSAALAVGNVFENLPECGAGY